MKRYIVMLVLAVVIMLGLMGAVQYFLARESANSELLKKAGRDMEESKRIAGVKAEVESAVRNVMGDVQSNLDNPDRYYVIATQMVRNNPHIVGAGVAFMPDYYKDKGKVELYAPYAFDEQPAVRLKKRKAGEPQIRTQLLGFDYTGREWFLKPLDNGKSLWTQPYVDQGGTHIIMCTYVEAVRNKSGQPVGVFFADVPMEDVSLLSIGLSSGLSRISKILLVIQLVSLLVVFLIIWLAAKASLRYKEQMVDAEKAQLIAEVEKLKAQNMRLTKRNIDLAKKNTAYSYINTNTTDK